jgi:hypothetical protein
MTTTLKAYRELLGAGHLRVLATSSCEATWSCSCVARGASLWELTLAPCKEHIHIVNVNQSLNHEESSVESSRHDRRLAVPFRVNHQSEPFAMFCLE